MSKDFKEKVFKYIKKEYGADPEYLWARFPDYAVFRHDDNKKWFSLVASHYTTSTSEKDSLVKAGWKYEGIAWYGVK